MVDASVIGMDDLLKKLKILPERIQKNVVVGAIRASAKPLVKEMRARAPKDTGALQKSIGVVRRREREKNIVRFSVAPLLKKRHGYLAHFHEFGTAKMPAHPFIRPALDAKVDETIDAAKAYMKKRIDKEIAKL